MADAQATHAAQRQQCRAASESHSQREDQAFTAGQSLVLTAGSRMRQNESSGASTVETVLLVAVAVRRCCLACLVSGRQRQQMKSAKTA